MNGAGREPQPAPRAPRRPPLAAAQAPAGVLLDPAAMLAVFRRELPGLADGPLCVLDCSVRPAKTAGSRTAFQDGRTRLVYRVAIDRGDGVPREYVLQATAPVDAAFPGALLEARCRALRDHPAVAPFRRLWLRVDALRLGLLLFPVDEALPALAELFGDGAAAVLGPLLPEGRAGARLSRCTAELRHYKPGERAVLRVQAEFAPPAAARTVYAKLFADDQGERSWRELGALAAASRDSPWLRVPEPLGYDPARRVLVLAEVPGGRALATWIHCLEDGLPLPDGVDLLRVEQGVLAAAEALAALQRCGVRPAARRTFADALGSLQKDRDLLRGAHGAPAELVAPALALVARLEAMAPGDEPLVPSHGGARHKQTVGDERTLAFVDWDGFCCASPALDPATFLARLQRAPIADPDGAPALARLADAFRARFLARAPAAAPVLPLYEALVFAEQSLRSFRRSARDAAESLQCCAFVRAAAARLAVAGARP